MAPTAATRSARDGTLGRPSTRTCQLRQARASCGRARTPRASCAPPSGRRASCEPPTARRTRRGAARRRRSTRCRSRPRPAACCPPLAVRSRRGRSRCRPSRPCPCWRQRPRPRVPRATEGVDLSVELVAGRGSTTCSPPREASSEPGPVERAGSQPPAAGERESATASGRSMRRGRRRRRRPSPGRGCGPAGRRCRSAAALTWSGVRFGFACEQQRGLTGDHGGGLRGAAAAEEAFRRCRRDAALGVRRST